MLNENYRKLQNANEAIEYVIKNCKQGLYLEMIEKCDDNEYEHGKKLIKNMHILLEDEKELNEAELDEARAQSQQK